MWSVVVHGGGFILLLFIGVMAAGLRGGCFWEVYSGRFIMKKAFLKISGTFGLVLYNLFFVIFLN